MPLFRQLTCALGDHIGGKDKGIEEEKKQKQKHLSNMSRSFWMGIPSLCCINCTTQFGVICKFAEGELDPFVYVVDKRY